MYPKSYGTVLRENPIVNEQYLKYSSNYRPWKKQGFTLPSSFDGHLIWEKYLSPIRNQGYCGNCWAIATTDMLCDRYRLYTLGQTPHQLSATQMTLCDYDAPNLHDLQKAFRDRQQLVPIAQRTHENSACNGNSLYNAIRYLYWSGVPTSSCISTKLKTGDLTEQTTNLPLCEDIETKEHNKCSTSEDMRVYRTIYPGIIKGCEEDGGSEEDIMYNLYMAGPLAGGFDMFPDFLDKYDGKTIYIHEKKEGEVSSGGHAIRIVGWGDENGVPYWICANSWGTSWGDNGYFRMKRGMCSLEKNIVTVIPDVPGLVVAIPISTGAFGEEERELRRFFQIEEQTKYPMSIIKKVKNLTPAINTKYIPQSIFDQHKYFIAAEEVPHEPPVIPKASPVKLENIVGKIHRKRYSLPLIFGIFIINLLVYFSAKNCNIPSLYIISLLIVFSFLSMHLFGTVSDWTDAEIDKWDAWVDDQYHHNYCIFSTDILKPTRDFKECLKHLVPNQMSYKESLNKEKVDEHIKKCMEVSKCKPVTSDLGDSDPGKWTDIQKKYIYAVLFRTKDKTGRSFAQCAQDCLNKRASSEFGFKDFVEGLRSEKNDEKMAKLFSECFECIKDM